MEKDYKKLYEDIVNSDWYKKAYVGKSIGDTLLVYPEWITDRMPTETKQTSDTLQGHREWTESEPVLAYDSSYGCCIDFTRNGRWASETRGGYKGQMCHGIIAWMPLPPAP